MTAFQQYGDTFSRLMPGDACLVICVGLHDGRKFHLEKGEQISIGRSGAVAVPLDSDRVSRVHARLARSVDGAQVVLTSLGRNGTFVNGERVDNERVLRDGDLIRIDATVLRFLEGEDVNAKYRQELYDLFVTDYLSGAHPREYLVKNAELELTRSKDTGEPLTLVVFELAGVEEFQTTHGSDAYYSVLRGVAEVAKGHLDTWESVARIDLRRFALLLPDQRGSTATDTVHRLAASIEKAHGFRIHFGIRPLRRGDDNVSVDQMLHEASLCLLRAQTDDVTSVIFPAPR